MSFREPTRSEPAHNYIHDLSYLVRSAGSDVLSQIIPVRTSRS